MISREKLHAGLSRTLVRTEFLGFEKRMEGKVRDSYLLDNRRFIVTTDRISAFDRVLGTLPYKGQVLNRVAAFWFEKTSSFIPNHMVGVPDPQVMEVKDCEPLPAEMVVRAYVTGTTSTSIWTHYKNGVRVFCGNRLKDGMKKHQKLDAPILTPSTKAEHGDHDLSVSRDEILAIGRISAEDFDTMAKMSLDLFAFGQQHCLCNGLILVDTKYEFGKDKDGRILVIDEVHTPDSSRFWQASTYEERFNAGQDPDGLDKEYVRTWLKNEAGFTGEGDIPHIPDEIRVEAAKRYINACKQITGEDFEGNDEEPIARITKNLGIQR